MTVRDECRSETISRNALASGSECRLFLKPDASAFRLISSRPFGIDTDSARLFGRFPFSLLIADDPCHTVRSACPTYFCERTFPTHENRGILEMASPPTDSTSDDNRDVLFQSAYGDIPKIVLYGMIPFLFLGSGALFVHAVWFGGGIAIAGFKLSPETVARWVCPAIWFLCALVLVLGTYRQLHPQCIVITEEELFLPKGRFTSEVIRIRWSDLKATIWSGQFSAIDIYERLNRRSGELAR